jgi:hypothetical protein
MMMAYLFLDTTMVETSVAGSAAPKPASASPSAGLTPLEWSVLALASTDRLSTLRKPGRIGIAWGHLFGKRHNPELADPRLEALRRVAVLMWHDSSLVPHVQHEALIAAGFTQAQYDLIVVRIASQSRRSVAGGRR